MHLAIQMITIQLTRIDQNHTDDSPVKLFLSFFCADRGSIGAQVKSRGRKSTERKEERRQKEFQDKWRRWQRKKSMVLGRKKKYCERMFQTWLAASCEFRLHPYIFSSLYGLLASSQFETTQFRFIAAFFSSTVSTAWCYRLTTAKYINFSYNLFDVYAHCYRQRTFYYKINI